MSSSSSNKSPGVPDHFQASAVQQDIQENQAPDGSKLPPHCRARRVTQKKTDEPKLARVREPSNTGSTKRIRSCAIEKNFEACIVPVELGNTKTRVEERDLKSLDIEKLAACHVPKSGVVGDGLSTSMPIDERTDVAISELPEPQVPAGLGFRDGPESANTSTPIPPADDWEALKAYACGPSALPTETLEAAAPLPSLPGLESLDSSAPPLCFQSPDVTHVDKLKSPPTPLAVYPTPARICQSGALDISTDHDNPAVRARSRPYLGHQLKQDPRLEYPPAHLNPPPGLVHPAVRRGWTGGEEQKESAVSLCKMFAGDEFVEHEFEDFLTQEADEEVSKGSHANHGEPRLKSQTKNKQRIVKQRCRTNWWRTTEVISSQPQEDEDLDEGDGEEEKPIATPRKIWAEVRQVLGDTEWAYGCSHPVSARCVPPVSSVHVQREGEEDTRPR